MYAVIRTGGKQYRVSAGQSLRVEKLPVEAGSEVVISDVLMVGEGEAVTMGAPLVAGAAVKVTVLSQGRGDKIPHGVSWAKPSNAAVTWNVPMNTPS